MPSMSCIVTHIRIEARKFIEKHVLLLRKHILKHIRSWRVFSIRFITVYESDFWRFLRTINCIRIKIDIVQSELYLPMKTFWKVPNRMELSIWDFEVILDWNSVKNDDRMVSFASSISTGSVWVQKVCGFFVIILCCASFIEMCRYLQMSFSCEYSY